MQQTNPTTNPVNQKKPVNLKTAVKMGGILAYLDYYRQQAQPINDSKILIGVIMILMNVATKYVDFGFSKGQEQAMKNGVAREIIIFAACFLGTRDIVLAILLTAAFSILANVFFHDESKYCLIPNYMKKIDSIIDLNKDGIISPEEERRAIDILEKAERDRTYNKHDNFMQYLNIHK